MKNFSFIIYMIFLIAFIVLPFVSYIWSFEKRIEIELFCGFWLIYHRIQMFIDLISEKNK